MKLSTKLWIKGPAFAIGEFLLIRVAGPNLVNDHDDMMFGVALLSMIGAIVLAVWLVPSILRDVKSLIEDKS